jgi:sulfatase modifying factor 1
MGDTFGDGDRDENPVHQVCLDDFYMDRHEVTRSEYQLVTGLKPIKYKACDSCPANGVSWFEAKDYCDQVGKRLPTEAEWEYAARSGGRKVKYATPNGQLSEELANYNSDKIMPVESYPPNPLGLYDMSGNVWEWVNDRYNVRYYMDSPTNNPEGPSEGYKESRVLRGGSWRPPPHWVRSSELRVTDRYCYNSKMHNRFNGFRCAESK